LNIQTLNKEHSLFNFFHDIGYGDFFSVYIISIKMPQKKGIPWYFVSGQSAEIISRDTNRKCKDQGKYQKE